LIFHYSYCTTNDYIKLKIKTKVISIILLTYNAAETINPRLLNLLIHKDDINQIENQRRHSRALSPKKVKLIRLSQ